MIKGSFLEELVNIPIVQIVVGWNEMFQDPAFILDTGFTGDLQVTKKIAAELGLVPMAVSHARIADGSTVSIPSALAIVDMEGVTKTVNAMISDALPLVGLGLLTAFGYKATIDCKNREVELQRM